MCSISILHWPTPISVGSRSSDILVVHGQCSFIKQKIVLLHKQSLPEKDKKGDQLVFEELKVIKKSLTRVIVLNCLPQYAKVIFE